MFFEPRVKTPFTNGWSHSFLPPPVSARFGVQGKRLFASKFFQERFRDAAGIWRLADRLTYRDSTHACGGYLVDVVQADPANRKGGQGRLPHRIAPKIKAGELCHIFSPWRKLGADPEVTTRM